MLEGALAILLLLGAMFFPVALAAAVEHLAARRRRARPAEAETDRAPRTSGLAVAAALFPFIAGPAGLFVMAWCLVIDRSDATAALAGMLVPLLGLALGVIALTRVSARPHQFRGKDWAKAGIVLSWYAAGVILMVTPVQHRALESRRHADCMSNMLNLARAMDLYLADNDSVFPPAGQWCDLISTRVEGEAVFRCPAARKLRCGYAFNAALSRTRLDDSMAPEHLVTIFESDRGWNAAGGPALLPDRPRHVGGNIYRFADAHVEWLPCTRLGTDNRGRPIYAKEPSRGDALWEPSAHASNEAP